jgi:Ca-activated chloride channel family protein
MTGDIVAIYPKEGTFYSDHPVGVVERDWVKPEHKEAAKLYIDYLLAEEQQVKALKYGFRPGSEKLKVGAPIDEAHGVKAEEPKLLPLPSVDVMRACLKSWKQNKKNVRVILVLDRSGSMNDDDKLFSAVEGCNGIIEGLGENDSMGVLTFSDKTEWVEKGLKLQKGDREKKKLLAAIGAIKADGETALYDAIAEAHDSLKPDDSVINALIVLTDGADNKSSLKLNKLLEKVRYVPSKVETRIYTIAYGSSGADFKVLEEIANAAKGAAYKSQPADIKAVIEKITTFF